MAPSLRPLLVAGALFLAACNPNAEVGSQIDDGTFGNASMNNVMIHSGQKSATEDLSRRFAAEVPTMVNFAFDSAALDAEASSIIRRQADWIRQFPEVRFSVFGHTDLVGSADYNMRLGKRRAEAVVNELVRNGISRSRLEAKVSFGKTQPLIFTLQPERKNRRTVTDVSGFDQRHPTVMNGKYAQVIFREYVNSAIRPHPTYENRTAEAP